MASAGKLCVATIMASLASPSGAAEARKPAPYLYAWAGDEDEKDSDFLSVIDADPASATYGKVVATAPIGGTHGTSQPVTSGIVPRSQA